MEKKVFWLKKKCLYTKLGQKYNLEIYKRITNGQFHKMLKKNPGAGSIAQQSNMCLVFSEALGLISRVSTYTCTNQQMLFEITNSTKCQFKNDSRQMLKE